MPDNTSAGPSQQGAVQEISAADFRHVCLPLFWKSKPKLWFVQLESEFSNYGIRSDERKYSAIIRHLDENTMTTEKQLRTLLSSIELGDKKPSYLLREMQSLAGENATEGLLRTLWLQRLPTRVQELLLILEDTDLGKLAECADKLHDIP
ncbi:hypothetical protein KPH14_012707 [Odynerus spinipes]|uniref:DUF7041 domain-containing protein n=1 Tax=Odynerus spinipes TaxID=1348599 RepID=A0AAD9REJ8_9HYME|nr:hypothetical protein KPH14_012707 [Odynerus spinipes]